MNGLMDSTLKMPYDELKLDRNLLTLEKEWNAIKFCSHCGGWAGLLTE